MLIKLILKLARATMKCYEFYNYITTAVVKMIIKWVIPVSKRSGS